MLNKALKLSATILAFLPGEVITGNSAILKAELLFQKLSKLNCI